MEEDLVGVIVRYVREGGAPGEPRRRVVQAAMFVQSSETGLQLLNLATNRMLEDVAYSETPAHNTWHFIGAKRKGFDADVYAQTIEGRREARIEAKRQQKGLKNDG